MPRDVLKKIKIARSQFSNQPFADFLTLIFRSLFKVESILIYVTDLDHVIADSGNQAIAGSVEKGEFAELEGNRKNMMRPCWEFSCDVYDGVNDFFIYKHDGLIGHISWVYYEGDPNRLIDLGPEEAEIKYALTVPQLRGKGIYPMALIEIQRYLQENGYKRVFVCVKEENHPSIRGIEKAGFKVVTRINLIKILGMQVSKRYATSHGEKNGNGTSQRTVTPRKRILGPGNPAS